MAKPYLVLFIGVLSISFAAIFIRLADAPPLVIAAYRLAIAAAIIIPFTASRTLGSLRGLSRRDLLLILLSSFFIALHFGLWITSLSYTSIASSVVLVTAHPAFVAIVSYFLWGERLNRLTVGGIAIALGGVFLLNYGGFAFDSPAILGNLLALVAGVLGARFAYVIENWRDFRDAGPLAVLNITSGGLIYYGGLIAAALAVVAYMAIRRLPMRRYIDILAISVMLGLAFGRAGCLLNGCCWGAPCDADWAFGMRFPMYSKPLVKLDGRPGNPYSLTTSGPTPVYAWQLSRGLVAPPADLVDEKGQLKRAAQLGEREVALAEATWSLPVKPAQPLGIINALLLAGVLSVFYRMRRREGQVFALMLILYPVTRFLLESIRADNDHNILELILTHNQVTSLLMFLAGIGLLVLIRRFPASAGPVLAERLAAAS